MATTYSKRQLMQYILGLCARDEACRIENAYFADRAVLQAIQEATDELIEIYLAGLMSFPLRNRFEWCLRVKPYLRQRVARARLTRHKLRSGH